MRTTHATADVQSQEVAAVDSNDTLYTERAQLKRERASIDSRLKALDEDIRERMLEGESFGDNHDELYLLPVETTTFDWKTAVAAGVLTQEQATPYLKRTLSTQIRSRKVERSRVSPDPGTAEAIALRERLEKAGKGLTGG